MLDDPLPTAILWIITILSAIFTFVFKLGEAAIEEVNEKKARERAEEEDKKVLRLVKLLDKKTALRDTSFVYVVFSLAICCFSSVMLLTSDFYYVLKHNVGSEIIASVLSFLIPILVTAFVFCAICVLLPNKLGSQRAEALATRLAGFLMFAKALIFPLKWIISLISGLFVLILGADPHYESEAVTEDEILSIVDQGEEEGVIEESQKEMIKGIFEFDDLTAGDVMTHRTDIEAVSIDTAIPEIIEKAIEEGYSRMPVFDDDIDNVKGIIYVKDLLKYVGNKVPAKLTAQDLMREACFIPESKKCRDLFGEMTEKHLQMVIVSDEYGGVAGIVTIEDLIESIMGNIQDEFDDEKEEIEQISENTFTIDGMSAIEEIEELLDIEFPEGEYKTVAGYIMSVLGRVPDADEHPCVSYEDFLFTVAEMDERRIARVIAERLPQPNDEETDAE